MVTVLITQLVLIRNVFYLCENAQNSHNFCSISVLFFFSLKDNIHGHLPMKMFLADYIPYSVLADAIRIILGIQLAMASAVTLQSVNKNCHG
jgi:hypothetical protein